jgi:PAS domain S-box-containing protein
VTWNETLERAMGLAPGEFEGTFEAFTDRVHPDDRKRVQKLIEQAVETGSMYQTDFRMRHEDGTDRWVEVRGQVVHDARGERMVGVHHDITERKEREKELQTLKQQYQTLVEHFPDGAVFLFDTEYRYVRARGEGLGAVDLSPTDVEGKTPHDLFPEAIADELEHHYRAALDGTSHVFEQSYDGNHYRVQTAPVETEETGVTYGMAVSLDVTEQVEQRREIKRQNERLEEFASIVSHDLRNPIGIAYGKLELAAEDCESPDLDDAKAALERGERLIDDLLMLALRGADIGEPEEVRLSAVVRNAWADIETDRASLEITGEQTVTADRSYVRQLVENVLTNAVRHAGPDATVTVGALDDGFYIEDTGPGIPEDEHEEIFEVGYSAANGGTGFGLRIVEQIAAAHDWKVRVTEGTDGGARFEFVGMGEQ